MGVLGGFLDSRNGFLDVSVDSVIRAASKTYDDDSCYLPVADVEKKVERLVFREGQRFNRTKGSFLIDSMKMCVPLSEQSQLVTLGHAALLPSLKKKNSLHLQVVMLLRYSAMASALTSVALIHIFSSSG